MRTTGTLMAEITLCPYMKSLLILFSAFALGLAH